MQQQGPKRRTTQIGMGQSGTRPRSEESVPSAPSSQHGEDAKQGVLCPPPSRPPHRTASAEHGTVEFSDDASSTLRQSVRERAASATNEIEQRAREELRRRDSVRERIAARRSSPDLAAARDAAARAETLPEQARADVAASREPSLEAREREAREARERLVRAAREAREAHEREVREVKEARERELRTAREAREAREREVREARDARERDARARGAREAGPAQPPRSERETLRRPTTWELDDPPPASRPSPSPRPPAPARPGSKPDRSSPPAATDSSPPISQRTRAALRVDEVGTAAVRLAARASKDATPKVLVQRRALASAPIDHREAFLVSLIDGAITVAGLVDVSGMPEAEVLAALQRLVRLGIVSL